MAFESNLPMTIFLIPIIYNISVPFSYIQDSKLLVGPGYEMPGSVKGSMNNVGWPGKSSSTNGFGTLDNRQHLVQGFRQNTLSKGQLTNSQYGTGQFGQYEETQYMDNNMAVNNLQFSQDESALYQTWATNGIYLDEVD